MRPIFMELRHLRYFVAVAEERHFGRAAERMNVAQPAVSEQIRRLEQELGVQLLTRSPRQVSVTDAGETLLEDARRLLELADDARATMRSWRAASGPRLRLGYVPDSLLSTLPTALRNLRRSGAVGRVELREDDPRRLLADVRAGRLDAAVVPLPAPISGLQVRTIGFEKVAVAHADGSPEASRDLAGLQNVTVRILTRALNPSFFDAITAGFRVAGVAPTVLEVDTRSIERLLLEVAADSGVALLPASVTERLVPPPGLRFSPLNDPEVGCPIGLVTAPSDVPSPVLAALHQQITIGEHTRALAAVA